MNYREPQPITKHELDLVIKQGAPEQICAALVDGVHSITDSEWLEARFLSLLHYEQLSKNI